MSNVPDYTRSAIVIFVMEGCPACDDYKPRLFKLIEHFQQHGQPMVYYQLGLPILPGQIPVIVLDGNSQDGSVVDLADRHKVEAMPTTLLLSRSKRPVKIEGAVDDRQIYDALVAACMANR